jgi:hypothetical protein
MPPTRMTATPPASFGDTLLQLLTVVVGGGFLDLLRIWATRASISALSPAPSTMVVSSLVMVIFLAEPSMSMVTFSSFMPRSSEITWPPVRIAMSCSMALRRSPKPGALTAAIFRPPRSLLTTRVASASPSTSSAMISSGFCDWMTCSSSGTIGCSDESFFSCSRMMQSSSSAIILSGLVTK